MLGAQKQKADLVAAGLDNRSSDGTVQIDRDGDLRFDNWLKPQGTANGGRRGSFRWTKQNEAIPVQRPNS